ncbi:hypothetical protein [Brevibacillus daliensis]|uniref:hypothetical protein n=1 Tax=Brevibacillus daliensis TaxID=2892995 RepID=UPI001E2DFA18|nr:hypothetical protein [Brevibacillus daliensis]
MKKVITLAMALGLIMGSMGSVHATDVIYPCSSTGSNVFKVTPNCGGGKKPPPPPPVCKPVPGGQPICDY